LKFYWSTEKLSNFIAFLLLNLKCLSDKVGIKASWRHREAFALLYTSGLSAG